jgi:proline dehydrogenase
VRRGGARALNSQIPVKLTQFGPDVDAGRCRRHLFTLAEETKRRGLRLSIDTEQSAYVDRTLEMRRSLGKVSHVGVCLQAYLYRNAYDVASLIPLGGGIRLVKGAYREPATIALPRKADVDDSYLTLATQMLEHHANLLSVFGTHDERLIDRIRHHAEAMPVPRDRFECHRLFGMQRDAQLRLAREDHCVKVRSATANSGFRGTCDAWRNVPRSFAKSMLSR